MARKAPYTWAAIYEVFLGGYSTLKNDHMTLMYAMWKKHFHWSCAKYSFVELPEKTPCERNFVFAIYGHFYEIDVFPLGAFSIRNFNLHNLKANELIKHCLFVLYFFFKQMHSTNLFLIKDEQAQKSIIFPTVLTLLSYFSQIQSILIYKSPNR